MKHAPVLEGGFQEHLSRITQLITPYLINAVCLLIPEEVIMESFFERFDEQLNGHQDWFPSRDVSKEGVVDLTVWSHAITVCLVKEIT
jgi:hypothetical protein